MNLLKRKTPVYTSLFDDLLYNQNFTNHDSFLPAVNIIEAEEYFDIQLAVPGKKKSDFKIEADEQVLTISSETISQSNDLDTNYARKEFGYDSFKRLFDIPETVATDNISATYKEGILTVSLPKKEEALPQPKKMISIK